MGQKIQKIVSKVNLMTKEDLENMELPEISVNRNEEIFVEKYRPQYLRDMILPESLRKDFEAWFSEGQIPNILLTSKTPGLGKSALANVIINELEAEALFINASLNSNIDTLRSKIQGFVSTASVADAPKIVVLDEFDFANANSTQPALRGFIEEFSANARFILTANYKDKIIEPIQNRMLDIDFDVIFKEHPELAKDIFKKVLTILHYENIEYNIEDVKYLIKKYYPSIRKIIMKIQQHSASGVLNLHKESLDVSGLVETLIENVKKKDFIEMRKNIQKLSDSSILYLEFYENLEVFPKEKWPEIVLILARYQANDPFVRDRVINTAACLTEIMQTI